ncbi:hypothetical protein V6V47_28995 [Micromonospora sp. CPCC 205539]|uniref:hypothetical protein n=1 Tax=Micromonospora sp. CPCC 205539 TaxID=3122408 RepID=UPI002FF394DC
MQTDSDTAITAATREWVFRTTGTAPSIVDTQRWCGDVDASGLHLYADGEAFRVGHAPAGQPAIAPWRTDNNSPLRP